MIYSYWCFYLFVVLKQFYLFSSGGLQPADLFLLLSFAIYIFVKKDRYEINFNVVDRPLFYFIVCVALVNSFYTIYYQMFEFSKSTLHYVYNFIVVIYFRELSKNKLFLVNVFKALKLNIWIQLIIFLLGLGNYYAGVRYMGTFNDPNQMSFFVYLTLMLMFLISKITSKKLSIIYYMIVTFLIFQTASTGMFLAIFLFSILFIVVSTLKLINGFKISTKSMYFFSSLFIFIILLFSSSLINLHQFLSDNFLLKRLEGKVTTEESNGTSLINERGIDKLIVYPERIILGAGQGHFPRFSEASHQGEIHSTIPSILFCYGVIPTLLLLIWFKNHLRKISFLTVVIFLPLLLESFTLLNQRQPFFWILFVLMYVYSKINVSNKHS